MNLFVKWPTRARPDLFRATLAAYQQDRTADYLVSIDHDDPSMNNKKMLAWLDAQPRLKYRIGNSKSKIEAVNDGLIEEPWDGICLLASDDMIPQRSDYAHRIIELFTLNFPNGDGVLHLNDGRNGPMLNTLAIFDRRYFDRFGYAYNPAFSSLWADNEFQEVSERLGRAVYVDEVIIKHNWVGDELRDDLHFHNETFYDVDRQVFEARRQAGFPT